MKCNLKFEKKEPSVILDVLQISSGTWYKGSCHKQNDFLFCRLNATSVFIIFSDGSFGQHSVDVSLFKNCFQNPHQKLWLYS